MRFLKKAYIGIVFLFLYAPILILMLYSFNDSRSRGKWGGFTLKWYGELFQDAETMSALETTLLIALLSAIIATVVGTVTAFGMHYMKKRPKAVLSAVSYLPVMNPDIVTGVSLLMLFLTLNIQKGFWTLLIAHISFNIPYVILSVMPKLKQMNEHLFEAAQDLGCNPFKAFFKVVLPEIMPGIVSGFLMAFTFSLDDFIISYFTSGATSQTLPITIYSMTMRKVSPEINALSTIIFLVVVIVLIVKNILENRNKEERA